MWNFICEIWDRVVRNWATSSVAIIATGVIIAGWCGKTISGTEVSTVIIGIQALILLFARD